MARVIQFKPLAKPRAEVVAHYEQLLARAQSGEIQGAITVLSIKDAADEMTICGVLAEEPAYATSAARSALRGLVGHDARSVSEPSTAARGKLA